MQVVKSWIHCSRVAYWLPGISETSHVDLTIVSLTDVHVQSYTFEGWSRVLSLFRSILSTGRLLSLPGRVFFLASGQLLQCILRSFFCRSPSCIGSAACSGLLFGEHVLGLHRCRPPATSFCAFLMMKEHSVFLPDAAPSAFLHLSWAMALVRAHRRSLIEMTLYHSLRITFEWCSIQITPSIWQ